MRPYFDIIDAHSWLTNLIFDLICWLGVLVAFVLVLPMALYWRIRDVLRVLWKNTFNLWRMGKIIGQEFYPLDWGLASRYCPAFFVKTLIYSTGLAEKYPSLLRHSTSRKFPCFFHPSRKQIVSIQFWKPILLDPPFLLVNSISQNSLFLS